MQTQRAWHALGVEEPLADTDLALRKAQTMAVTTVVLYQVFYLFQCRSLQISALRLDAANPSIYLGVGATLAMHGAFVHAPPMHELFHSAAPGPAEWLLSDATAASVVPAVALHKWITRRRASIRGTG